MIFLPHAYVLWGEASTVHAEPVGSDVVREPAHEPAMLPILGSPLR